ncbi:unnamed protein product [Mortierella alpina]
MTYLADSLPLCSMRSSRSDKLCTAVARSKNEQGVLFSAGAKVGPRGLLQALASSAWRMDGRKQRGSFDCIGSEYSKRNDSESGQFFFPLFAANTLALSVFFPFHSFILHSSVSILHSPHLLPTPPLLLLILAYVLQHSLQLLPRSLSSHFQSSFPITFHSMAAATTTSTQVQHLQPVTAELQQAPAVKARDPFWLGGAASCCAAFVSHPFDLAKVRLQTTQGASSQGMVGTMINVARHEGIFALYNGLSASLLRQGTYSTVRFGTYDLLKEKFAPKDGSKIPVSTMLLCGVLAGCIGGGFGNPADVVNIRMVNDGKLPMEQRRHYKHAFDGLFRIVKEEGPGQLMRGLGPNMNRAILMTSSQLVSYDGFKRQLLATPWFHDNLATHFASSLLAVSCANARDMPPQFPDLFLLTMTMLLTNAGSGCNDGLRTTGCAQDKNYELIWSKCMWELGRSLQICVLHWTRPFGLPVDLLSPSLFFSFCSA